MSHEQLARIIDGTLLALVVFVVGGMLGEVARWLAGQLICGSRAQLRDKGTVVCELRPLHRGAHRQGLTRWVDVDCWRGHPAPRRCWFGHLHPNMASRDRCETTVRRLGLAWGDVITLWQRVAVATGIEVLLDDPQPRRQP